MFNGFIFSLLVALILLLDVIVMCTGRSRSRDWRAT